jgi:hypothetical protein
MSIVVTSKVMVKLWGSSARKAVALILADFAREDGSSIFPSVETIAAHAEVSPRQVKRILKVFVEKGLLIVVRQGGGQRKSTLYRFAMDAIHALPDAKPQGKQAETLVADFVQPPQMPETVTFATTNSDTMSPNPSLPVSIPSSKEKPASAEAGAAAPSINKLIWQEGQTLLNADPSRPNRSIIGKWLKRTISQPQKEKLLEIIRLAARGGTADPVAYVIKALDQEYPHHPTPVASI